MINIRAISLALQPGAIEDLEEQSVRAKNSQWQEMCKEVRWARDALHIYVALTLIAAAGTIFMKKTLFVVCAVSLPVFLLCSALSAKELYDQTVPLITFLDQGYRP